MNEDPDDFDELLSADGAYLVNYVPEYLYIHPDKRDRGAYVTLVSDNETLLGEIEVTSRSRLAVTAFFVKGTSKFDTVKIRKLKLHSRRGWQDDGEIQINNFDVAKMGEFVSIISSLDLSDVKKAKLSLENLNTDAIGPLLSSSKGNQIRKQIAACPNLHDDIYAIAAKRQSLNEFDIKLRTKGVTEPEWQCFFDSNRWIIGLGLNYIFLDCVGRKLEANTTGNAFDRQGKRADALPRTRAEVSQYVLVEIKRNDTKLLQEVQYRAGCWSVSDELSHAVTQIQKTVFEFGRDRWRDNMKDGQGTDTGVTVYSVQPRSFLVIGNLSNLVHNDDMVTCFELYRRNITAPEILTFDELFHRAKCIVDNLDR